MKNKTRLTYKERRESSKTRKFKGTVAGLIALTGVATFGGSIVNCSSEKNVEKTFRENCGIERTVDIKHYGDFGAQPYPIAREEFQKLRERFPERFERISNDSGTEYLMEHNYNPSTGKLSIPDYDCK